MSELFKHQRLQLVVVEIMMKPIFYEKWGIKMTIDEIIELGFREIDSHGNVADAVHYSPEIGAHITVAHLLNNAPDNVKSYIMSQIPYIFSYSIQDEKKILNFREAYIRKHLESYQRVREGK